MDKNQAMELIRGSALAEHADLLMEHLAPSARIVLTDDGAQSNENGIHSYFGGLPKLPKEASWPSWDSRAYSNAKIARLEDKFRQNPRATGLRDIAAKMRENLPAGPTPLTFLAKLDLSALADSAPLDGWPTSGTLLFFYGGGWGYDPLEKGNCCVLYFPVEIALTEVSPPAAFAEQAFRRRPVGFWSEWTLPGHPRKDWSNDRYRTLREQFLAGRYKPIHRSGGWPEEIQGDMRLECQLVTNGLYCGDASGYRDARARALEKGATDWKLLLQVDSDDAVEWMWGDVGRVYFWARQQDILARDFESAWAIQQCY
jgi:uncharacterized protein YwqG